MNQKVILQDIDRHEQLDTFGNALLDIRIELDQAKAKNSELI